MVCETDQPTLVNLSFLSRMSRTYKISNVM